MEDTMLSKTSQARQDKEQMTSCGIWTADLTELREEWWLSGWEGGIETG